MSSIFFRGLQDDDKNNNIDTFCSEYTGFNQNNGNFDGGYFIQKSKDIQEENIHLWHQKYSLPCTNVLGFVACRETSKIIGIGAAERSWGDIKMIKSGKRSSISSDVPEKQSIVCTFACIGHARI